MIKWIFYLLIFLAIRAFLKSRVRVVYRGPSSSPRPTARTSAHKINASGAIETVARTID